MRASQQILQSIPKWMLGIITAGIILPLLAYAITQFAVDAPIELSLKNTLYILAATLVFILLTLFVGAWRVISSSQRSEETLNDRKRELAHTHVTIGDITDGMLSVGIRAEIVLLENSQPDIDSFLNRIGIGDPYCSNCSKPLDIWRGSWMVDGVQIGYKCADCQTENSSDYSDVLKLARGEVRRNYDSFWSKYQEEINALTGGHPEKYKLPY